jgi:hypothetical protein
MSGTTNEPATNGAGHGAVPVTVTARKRRRTWYWALSDGTTDPIGHPTKKAALAAGADCIEVRAMNAAEDARRATRRAFVHPGCERVMLDQLIPGDRAWIVMAMSGVSGDRYPTRWADVVIDHVRILIPNESAMIFYRDPALAPNPPREHLLAVFDYLTIGANRVVDTVSDQEK